MLPSDPTNGVVVGHVHIRAGPFTVSPGAAACICPTRVLGVAASPFGFGAFRSSSAGWPTDGDVITRVVNIQQAFHPAPAARRACVLWLRGVTRVHMAAGPGVCVVSTRRCKPRLALGPVAVPNATRSRAKASLASSCFREVLHGFPCRRVRLRRARSRRRRARDVQCRTCALLSGAGRTTRPVAVLPRQPR
nr:unnamed protein product [Digitaria exilis]